MKFSYPTEGMKERLRGLLLKEDEHEDLMWCPKCSTMTMHFMSGSKSSGNCNECGTKYDYSGLYYQDKRATKKPIIGYQIKTNEEYDAAAWYMILYHQYHVNERVQLYKKIKQALNCRCRWNQIAEQIKELVPDPLQNQAQMLIKQHEKWIKELKSNEVYRELWKFALDHK